MEFSIPEELQALQELVREFVRRELRPLEKLVIEREANRGLGNGGWPMRQSTSTRPA